ncbi:MAG: hypothetical protein C0424_10350 [Sphingobacteriaceae bacterium]|nr:hypothetical protein [Sphingobacteriaceae bacterium]
MSLALENISRNVPAQNTGGTGDHILVTDRANVTAIPAPATTGTLEAAGAIASTAITLAASTSWRRLEVTLDKGGITSEPLGGRDHTTFRNTATVMSAGNNAQKVGFANFVANRDLIVLVPERNTGLYRLFGSLTDPAHIKPASGTGEGPEGANEARWVIESIGRMPRYVTGTVTVGP